MRKRIVTCLMCGGKFETANGNQRYCGPICMLEAKREQGRRYYQRNKEMMRRKQRERYKANHKERQEPIDADEAARIAVAALTENQRECLRFLLEGEGARCADNA